MDGALTPPLGIGVCVAQDSQVLHAPLYPVDALATAVAKESVSITSANVSPGTMVPLVNDLLVLVLQVTSAQTMVFVSMDNVTASLGTETSTVAMPVPLVPPEMLGAIMTRTMVSV